MRRIFVALFLITFGISAPLSSVAALTLTDYVKTSERTVSRSDFISWTYTALRLPKATEKCTLPYKRVPRGLVLTLCDAKSQGVLEIFDSTASNVLRRPITRGEALKVLTALTHFTERDDVSKFRDVKEGDDVQAVMNAIVLKWMTPKTANTFGIADTLSGTEALTLLQSVLGETEEKTTITISLPDRSGTVDIPEEALLDAVWEVVKRDYLRSDNIDEQEAAYRALEAMMDSLDDPYSTFFRPARASDFQSQIKGEFTGIGANVIEKDGFVTIVSPLPGSPAEKAGLLPGDQVLKVGTTELRGLTLEQAISHIRGERGSTAVLSIMRNGNPMTISVVRDLINIPEIETQWHGTVAVLKLVQFGETTESKVKSVVQSIASKNPTGVVLDLRNNGGGLLSAAESVMSAFVPRGTVYAKVKSRMREREEVTLSEPVLPSSVKMIVLVNEASASASEIVAGALQDLKRARVVGTKSFGKGTVQEVVSFTGGSAIKLTIAEWFTPLGRTIEDTGVMPDIVIESEDRDEQLRRALELLR
ncbi:MAG: S41 family peptidase [Candidatus Peribacteraceae bacterium]